MKVSKRQKTILLDIINRKGVHINTLCKELMISNKTLSKEIISINNFFKEYETEIILNGKKGYEIKSIYPSSEIINIINANQQLSSKDEVQLVLLLSKEGVGLAKLEEELYISRPTLLKYINEVSQRYDIKKEKTIYTVQLNDIKRIYEIIEILELYMDPINYRITFKLVIEHLGFKWDNKYFQYDVVKELANSNGTIYTDESVRRYYILKNLQMYFKIEDKKVNDMQILRYKKVTKDYVNNKDYLNILKILQEKISLYSNIDIQELLPLAQHLYSTLSEKNNYNQNEIYVFTKYLTEFKAKYPLIIELSTNILNNISKYNKYEDYEIYFVALHIQIIFEKNLEIRLIKILVICEYGIGLSNYLSNRLKVKLTGNIEVNTISLLQYQYNKEYYKDYDYICTTIMNFTDETKKVVHITPFLSEKEISYIDSILIKQYIYDMLFKLLKQHLVFANKSLKQEADIYKFLTDKLKDNVKADYIKALEKRNNQGSVIINNIMFLHADANLVINDLISIITLEKSMLIKGKNIDIIFIHCFTSIFIQKNQSFLKYFYRAIANDVDLKEILNKKTNEELYKYVLSIMKENK